jgi:hypothetical protein
VKRPKKDQGQFLIRRDWAMDLYPGNAEDLMRRPGHRRTSNDMEHWQRWDEELVEEFGCWVSRLAKACAILLIAVFTGALLQLL